ncbi:MAG: hypothetical protein NVSMB45_07410 [Ginsengibacter sp.]
MEITINQKTKHIPEQTSIAQFLQEFIPGNQQGIAVAINHTVVVKTMWNHHIINPHDHILIINATQGG